MQACQDAEVKQNEVDEQESTSMPSTLNSTEGRPASTSSNNSSSTSEAAESEPAYLAAGVLPFCLLGGDVLFLLGQQLRFCSRGRSSPLAGSSHVDADAGEPRVVYHAKGRENDVAGGGEDSGGILEARQDTDGGGGGVHNKNVSGLSLVDDVKQGSQQTHGDIQQQQQKQQQEGKERQKSEQIPAGLLWSDFGGGREAGDADAEGTASREFAEESFGLFHGVRLESDSVARSQSAMESLLRDKSLRGKHVFECRNGGYVMFVAKVDFVPDMMMKLARKQLLDHGSYGADDADEASSPGFCEKTDFAWVPASSLMGAMRESRHRSTRKVVIKLGGCRYLRLFHKFVISLHKLNLPAVIKAASTPLHRRKRPLPAPRIILLKAGDAIAAAGAPGQSKQSSSAARREISGSSSQEGHVNSAEGQRQCEEGDNKGEAASFEKRRGLAGGMTVGACAIRGIDCIRPSFLSGRKRTSLGIIDPAPPRGCRHGGYRSSAHRQYKDTEGRPVFEGGPVPAGGTRSTGEPARGDGGITDDGSAGEASVRGMTEGQEMWWSAWSCVREQNNNSKAGGDERIESDGGGDTVCTASDHPLRTTEDGNGGGGSSDAGCAGEIVVQQQRRRKKSGAACRKRRRRCKEARRRKAAAAADAAGKTL